MRKRVLTATLIVISGVSFASDPGGLPGLVKAAFTGSTFDSTGNVYANALGYTYYPTEMYATSCPEKTTYAWAGYMKMESGVSYDFKGCYDDYVTVKIAGTWVLSQGGTCAERTGTYKPTATDWYAIEFRVGNNGSVGGIQKSSQYGILWKKSSETEWHKVEEYDNGQVFKTGQTGLKSLNTTTPRIVSSQMRANDPTVLDVVYKVVSDQPSVKVRALAFQDGERSFWKAVRVTEFVNDPEGKPTAQNIGDKIPANVEHKLAWKVSKDWKTDLARVKFEVLCSDQAQIPLKLNHIKAVGKYPALTVAVGEQSSVDVYNALMWYYADGAEDLVNENGYLESTCCYPGTSERRRLANRDTLATNMEALRYVYEKMGFKPLVGGNTLAYVRNALRRELWYNSEKQNVALLKGSAPDCLYVGPAAFCIVDVSAGHMAESYSVTYRDDEPVAGWSDEFKTRKILLRRVDPCVFTMQGNRQVTLTKAYYIGVFPVTQCQYKLVLGANPTPSAHHGEIRPVEVSWNAIRGNSATNNWPTVSAVDEASFIGKLQAKTKLPFDLPTEAQWECACRAGTDSDYNNGGKSKDDLRLIGSVGVVTADVGKYEPNAWGLYDMHANAAQWCLDAYGDLDSDPVVDPTPINDAEKRVVRGCNYYRTTTCNATSKFRRGEKPERDHSSDNGWTYEGSGTCAPIGFRISLSL